MIVGIDPGTTVGVSILDTEGNIIHVTSRKYANKNEIISLVSSYGRPIIVSSDKNPTPKYVEKVSSSFGSKLFFPEQPLLVKQKYKITRDYLDAIHNTHEMDSLAAAIIAWKANRKSIEKNNKKTGEMSEWLRRNTKRKI